MEDLVNIIRASCAKLPSADIAGLAIGIPTTLAEDGGLAPSDNLPTLAGFPLARHLEQELQLPVRLANDADCFTVGEWWQGMGKGARNFCGLTLGTGLGLGLVLDGRLYRGSHNLAGEIWKSPWEEGRLEERACGPALENAYAARSGRRLNGADIAGLAGRGEAYALECFAEFGNGLGRILAFVINLVDPEAVAIGGSMAASFHFFRDALMKSLIGGTLAGQRARVVPSSLGERAALLGAAKVYRDTAVEKEGVSR